MPDALTTPLAHILGLGVGSIVVGAALAFVLAPKPLFREHWMILSVLTFILVGLGRLSGFF